MSECCAPQRQGKGLCPECGKEGPAVQKRTLESFLIEPFKIKEEPYWFCATAECPLVYFSAGGSSVFYKADLKIRVGVKENEDPIPICYCFGWDRQKILNEIKQTGKSTAISSITKEVKAGRCFCEQSNPQGTCCLGNIARVLKEG